MIFQKSALVLQEAVEKASINYTTVQFREDDKNMVVEATDGYTLFRVLFPKDADAEAFFPPEALSDTKEKIQLSKEDCIAIANGLKAEPKKENFSVFRKGAKIEVHIMNAHWSFSIPHETFPDFDEVFSREKTPIVPFSLATKLLKKIAGIAGKLKMVDLRFESYGENQPVRFKAGDSDDIQMIGLIVPICDK